MTPIGPLKKYVTNRLIILYLTTNIAKMNLQLFENYGAYPNWA